MKLGQSSDKAKRSKDCLGNSAVKSEPPRPTYGEAGTGKRAKQEAQMDHSIQSSRSKERIIIIANGIKVLSKPADATRRKKLGERSGEG